MIKNIMMILGILALYDCSLANDSSVNNNTPTVEYNGLVTTITIKDEGHDLVTLLWRSLWKGKTEVLDIHQRELKTIRIVNESQQLVTTDDIQRCLNEFSTIEKIILTQRNNGDIERTQINVDGKTVTIKRGSENDITIVAVDTRPKDMMNTTLRDGRSNMDPKSLKSKLSPKSTKTFNNN